MNFRQLECFREIMTTGTVTGAAKALGISQPSASGLIANLERELGFPLFRRVRGRLAPTPEAHYLSSDIERTLDSVELTAQRARQIRDQTFGNLVIAAYPDIAVDFLPRIVSRFRAGRPELRVTVLARRSEMMQGILTTQLYDLAIVETSVDIPRCRSRSSGFAASAPFRATTRSPGGNPSVRKSSTTRRSYPFSRSTRSIRRPNGRSSPEMPGGTSRWRRRRWNRYAPISATAPGSGWSIR